VTKTFAGILTKRVSNGTEYHIYRVHLVLFKQLNVVAVLD
jgi:hypothetical protein